LSARYYHSDHVGSNTLVTRSDGSTVQESILDPFGELLHQPLTSASNAYLFTDQERDGETGLDYFGARYYDPWVGRFMSVDPESLGGSMFRVSAHASQALNGYSYVMNRPTALVDPDGRQAMTIEQWFLTEVSGGNEMVEDTEEFMNEDLPEALGKAAETAARVGAAAAEGAFGRWVRVGKWNWEVARAAIASGTAEAFQIGIQDWVNDQFGKKGGEGSVIIIDLPPDPPPPTPPPEEPSPEREAPSDLEPDQKEELPPIGTEMQ